MTSRHNGILVHLTSLPSPFGVGDLGPEAHRFVDTLAAAKQSLWQILPINPTTPGFGNSPYGSYSSFAGNPLLISPEFLVRPGYLREADISNVPDFPASRVDYHAASRFKQQLFCLAWERRKKKLADDRRFLEFCREQSAWLNDHALFCALKNHFKGSVWNEWDKPIRDRKMKTLQLFRQELKVAIQQEQFLQYLFFEQWTNLKSHCHKMGVKLVGDLPIYVHYDSCDVWSHSKNFKLDSRKKPVVVAGVPPDYFSATGQLWGNPVYDWDWQSQDGYRWWVRRFAISLKRFDYLRVDHFRGFVGYWEVPATEETAINGYWVKAPADDFFATLRTTFRQLPLVAEDLGEITPDVREVMHRFDFPGMKILLFTFGEDTPDNPYSPHNYDRRYWVYPGTHDTNTIKGWYQTELPASNKKRLRQYLGKQVTHHTVSWDLIRLAMGSVAEVAIIPLQDVLGLGDEARMNIPATSSGNWEWRFTAAQLNPDIIEHLASLTKLYGRAR